MNREYHKWNSRELYRDMEMLVYGHAGFPTLVFPTSRGRFYEYEDNAMVATLAGKIEACEIQLFCVDAVDAESWYNRGTHPHWRVVRHVQYENYILNEVIPYIRWRTGSHQLTATGCSFGAYHAMNLTLRHPEPIGYCVAMSGAFDMHPFLDGYYDNDCYFNCPVDFVPNLNDPSLLHRFGNGTKLVLAAGEWDICLGENLRMSGILHAKGIPHMLDIWGNRAKHDWPLWREMALKFF